MSLYIPVLHGTGRTGNISAHAAKFAHAQLVATGVRTDLFEAVDFHDGRTHHFSESTEQGKKWKAIMAEADGLVIVSPEYNHGYPGELKLALDAAYKQYFYKPVAICGVSDGILGGARMVEQLRQVVIELHMVPLRDAVYFANDKTLFDAAGQITDPEMAKRFEPMYKDLLWYAELLKKGRATRAA